MRISMKITKQEYENFEAYYTWTLIKAPDFRFGQAFMCYFSEAEDYLRSNSHLGGNPGHAPNDDSILWEMKNKRDAENFILDRFDIV